MLSVSGVPPAVLVALGLVLFTMLTAARRGSWQDVSTMGYLLLAAAVCVLYLLLSQ